MKKGCAFCEGAAVSPNPTGDGAGYGVAKCKTPVVSWIVTVE